MSVCLQHLSCIHHAACIANSSMLTSCRRSMESAPSPRETMRDESLGLPGSINPSTDLEATLLEQPEQEAAAVAEAHVAAAAEGGEAGSGAPAPPRKTRDSRQLWRIARSNLGGFWHQAWRVSTTCCCVWCCVCQQLARTSPKQPPSDCCLAGC
jgi:hypothetical protein